MNHIHSETQPPRPVVRSPATPSELLTHILSHLRHPSTILICWPKPVFLAALVQDVSHGLSIPPPDDQLPHQPHLSHPQSHRQTPSHPLLHASLLQRAVSRHLRIAFIPTVAHLRAYLTVYSRHDPASPVTPPPIGPHTTTSTTSTTSIAHPALLVYGLLELHRDGSEWSAQGLGISTAALIESAARCSLRPVLVEPRGAMGYDRLDEFLDEDVPILSGTSPGNDETVFRRRSVPIRKVLSRWFSFEQAAATQVPAEGQQEREAIDPRDQSR